MAKNCKNLFKKVAKGKTYQLKEIKGNKYTSRNQIKINIKY